MSEGPFRQRLGRIKFAEPSRDRALQFIHRLSRKAAVNLQHSFAEPSRDIALRVNSKGLSSLPISPTRPSPRRDAGFTHGRGAGEADLTFFLPNNEGRSALLCDMHGGEGPALAESLRSSA